MSDEGEIFTMALVSLLQPETVIVAKVNNIHGYRFDKDTKTLHFLSEKETKEATEKGLIWFETGQFPSIEYLKELGAKR